MEVDMNINFIKSFDEKKADAKVVFVFKDYLEELIPEGVRALFKERLDKEVVSLAKGSTALLFDGETPVMIVSMGDSSENACVDSIRLAAHKMAKLARKEKLASVELKVQPSNVNKAIVYRAISEMVSIAEYEFDRYKTDKKENVFVNLYIVDTAASAALEESVKEGQIVAAGVNETRFLVDEPSNKIYPKTLAEHAKRLGKEHGFDVEILEKDKIEKLGMDSYLNVARASAKEPKLIVMRYNGGGKSDKKYGLVGKGLTYDSGGYSLKPSNGMLTMKMDMGGGAVLIGSMVACAKAKLPVNIVAVIAACENMVSGDGYRPGDIISSMGGKSIYVGNTDAEGRLTLIDAITYSIREEKVDQVFDFATLTGAAIAAFGNACAATLTNNEEVYADYCEAAKLAGEKQWRLPIFPEYEELIKHHEADLTNSAGNPGTITAGLFLKQFVEDKPWIHVDIAPVTLIQKPFGYWEKGATGYGVKTVYEYMKARS